MKIRVNMDLNVGRVVKYFIFVDLALLAGWGLVDPILSVFVVDNIAGATLVTVGTGAAIYWLLRSMLQIPFARYLDRRPGERDDFYALIVGLIIAAFSAILFGFVTRAWQFYLVQALHAVGLSLYAASWPAIFSRHLDKDNVSFDWALDSTAVGIAAGTSGFLGSVLASRFGFGTVFILAGVFTALSALVLLSVPDLVLPPVKTEPGVGVEHRSPTDVPR